MCWTGTHTSPPPSHITSCLFLLQKFRIVPYVSKKGLQGLRVTACAPRCTQDAGTRNHSKPFLRQKVEKILNFWKKNTRKEDSGVKLCRSVVHLYSTRPKMPSHHLKELLRLTQLRVQRSTVTVTPVTVTIAYSGSFLYWKSLDTVTIRYSDTFANPHQCHCNLNSL